MRRRSGHRDRGFTLIELLVVVSLVVIVLAVGVPSYRDYIINNRLKAVNSQLVSDLHFARAEAAARNMPVFWSMRSNASMTCYTIFTRTDGSECNCTRDPPLRCGANQTEVKTTQVRADISVQVSIPAARTFAFDHVNGGVYFATTDFADADLREFEIDMSVSGDTGGRILRTKVSPAGRVSVCSLGSRTIAGYRPC